ncbi:MAG: Sulfur carrier protein DsrE2 [Rhodocyclaceae bacterium]|nr:Sulfur carrier protein DsrE2 [Rhodocyclaceae bacterium]CAG0929722.1 Sulfur carrier protein DsrE2 [Rhodocyclaceae bacterium]
MNMPTDQASLDALIRQRIDEILPQKIEELQASKTPSMTIIATKGTLDWAYPPFILASTAAALGWNVSIFFTFYGLNLLKKDVSDLKVSPLGNPGMPMKMPFGPDWFKGIDWNKFLMPNIIQSNLPGFESVATMLMKQTIKNNGVASIEELRALSQEADVRFIGCQMTVDLFGFTHDDFIDGIEYAGAATFLPQAQQADVSLFM